jgi:hypothetical protein
MTDHLRDIARHLEEQSRQDRDRCPRCGLKGKRPGVVRYLRLLVTGSLLTLSCLLAVYLLAVGIVGLEALADSQPPDPSRAWPAGGDPAPDFVLKDTDVAAVPLPPRE